MRFAINTFHQLGATPAYKALNINKKYVKNVELLDKAYLHYVHHLMRQRFIREQKAPGKFAADEKRKVNQKNQDRLCKARYTFAVKHGYPRRYIDIIDELGAHSDDEYSPEHGFFKIKTLPYRLKNASKFFCCLDVEMMKEEILLPKQS
ncbi:hypothetical protein PtA15_4A825 [Puccinia triticina]|uniref:Uncharacterized protein n=1 Tax=Puccinia triticina TaxID=208348 RepID=A0ABY7CNL5_9BASI|nr:uncharacterized protein PtA15_4A825 [Puccinia triticina]WAQ84372.1 hypothetical protein PtA15_4A825 [Puccinia triticina]